MRVMERCAGMGSLCDEVLALILCKLPIRDAIRARGVCRRWEERINAERARSQCSGYCPLAFERSEQHHTWSGYDVATNKWEPLPSLSNVPRVIHLVPIPGSGHASLLGFKISQVYSGYIVGNPYSQKWTTLPKSADSWGDAAMFMTTSPHDGFRVVAVREEDTHIYKSEVDTWSRVGCSPQGQAASRIKSKVCAFLDNRLYTTDGNVVISFDMDNEHWTDDRIDLPALRRRDFQLVASAGTLFVVTEEDDTISVWALGLLSHQFSLAVTIPAELRRGCLAQKGRASRIRSVGYGQHLFFWRHNSMRVVSYDVVTRQWRHLPEIQVQADIFADDGPQIAIDAGFFEPQLAR